MKPGTFEYWAKLGWQLDPLIAHGLGEIVNTGNGPYYIGDQQELGYHGHGHPMVPSRFAMGMRIGRLLTSSEVLRFISEDKKDLRLSNVVFHSKQASAAELFKANGTPVLGYSHCLCGCGTELDLEIQVLHPYAYTPGHNPLSKKDKKNQKRSRPRKSILVGSLAKVAQPLLYIPKEEPMPDTDPLKEYRTLFEKMIHNLPWPQFKELLTLLLEIQTRKDSS
jgi:hypothetical protein